MPRPRSPGSYVRRQLASEAGVALDTQEDLVEALQDLFRTFFPGKSFEGPVPTPDGRVEFPVSLPDGSTHDLDDLSSGEKEVLYGYMRLRSSAPKHSVVLVDEPELHLNPRLMRGLARFYFDHLVKRQSNQLWLISHSDSLLREAINLDGFGVYHMVRGERGRIGENQATKITTEAEAERLVIELVGDLAAYRPGAKVVLFAGGGDVEFDVLVVTRLFPSFADRTNLIAAGNKRQVLALHRVLDSLNADALGARFYAVHDRDSGPPAERAARQFEWDRYHIENYLLEPGYVLRALAELTVANHALADADAVKGALRESARRTVKRLVRHELQVFATDAFRNTLRIGAEHSEGSVADALRPSIDGARERVVHLVDSELSPSELSKREQQLEESFVADLDSDAWMKKFRGRDVLRDFVSHHVPGVSYETVRDLVLARMKDDGFEPPGMAQVLDQIVADRFP
jgi:AAA domain, putative AbiEii toxin, Type IV TA system